MEPMHNWDVSVDEAVAIQEQLRVQVRLTNRLDLDAIRTVAGIDASYHGVGKAAIVVMRLPDREVVDQAVAERSSVFPYTPGLLSFREIPVVLDALARLRVTPDVLLCDGYGYAHPRRFGLASHLGVYLDRPAIGCAKTRFIGTAGEPGPHAGDWAPLVDSGETIGAVLRTQVGTKPVYISAGHLIDLQTAIAVVLRCVGDYRLPEPTRLADILAHPAAGAALPRHQ